MLRQIEETGAQDETTHRRWTNPGLSVEVKPAVRPPTRSSSPKELIMANSLAKELWTYLKVRKKFWLAPIIILMAFLGAVMIFAQGSALAPFIYSIF
jgi:hypothetical protein